MAIDYEPDMNDVPEERELDLALLRPTSASPSTPVTPSSTIPVVNYQTADDVRWRYVRGVGVGSYGVVDKVEDLKRNNAFFARKMMRREDNTIAQLNFDKELENLSRLRNISTHHHLVELIEAYTFSDDYYLVINPLADMTLRALFDAIHNKRGRHSKEHYADSLNADSLRILRPAFGCLAHGLAFLHSNHIRHKDIKPTNILIYQKRVLYTGGSHFYYYCTSANGLLGFWSFIYLLAWGEYH
jgi:hypothetical protein